MKLPILLPLAFLLAVPCGSLVAAETPAASYVTYQAKTADAKQPKGKRAAKEMNEQLRDQGVDGMDSKSPDRWPTQVPVPSSTRLRDVSSKSEEGENVYESNNYRFTSQVPISDEGQISVGRLFECTYAACKAVGRVIPVPRTRISHTRSKLDARLYKDMEAYYAAEGPKGSAGCFRHMQSYGSGKKQKRQRDDSNITDYVMVPFPSMGLDASGNLVNKDVDSHTLVHELTHQSFCMNNLPVWANEGWAEYMGYVPYMGEVLDFDKCFATILLNAKNPGRAPMLKYNFAFEDFFTMSQEDMYAPMMRHESDTYMLATLYVSFFVHLDGKRGIRCMKVYMGDLLKGTSNEKALKKLATAYKGMDKLEEAFLKAWEEKGVKISFKGGGM